MESKATTSETPTQDQRFSKHVLVWIDLELTGLDLQKDTIVEIAVILTDHRLRTVLEGPNYVIHTEPHQLSDWCTETFSRNGLLKDMQESTMTIQEAEAKVLEFITQRIPTKGIGILAGSSVHVDRIWLLKYMPRLTDYLHYRIVDVSGIHLLAKSWYPWMFPREEPEKKPIEGETATPTQTSEFEDVVSELDAETKSDEETDKKGDSSSASEMVEVPHRAMYDIRQSIEKLKFLKKSVFKDPVKLRAEHQQRTREGTVLEPALDQLLQPRPVPGGRHTKTKGKKGGRRK